jgi:hypothetical protein
MEIARENDATNAASFTGKRDIWLWMLSFDEMKLQDLVFEVKSNELVGFIDLSDIDKEMSELRQ